jgi:hypothetical protein
MMEVTAPPFRLLFSQAGSVRAKQVYDLVTTYIRAGENTIGKNTYFYTVEHLCKTLKKKDIQKQETLF